MISETLLLAMEELLAMGAEGASAFLHLDVVGHSGFIQESVLLQLTI